MTRRSAVRRSGRWRPTTIRPRRETSAGPICRALRVRARRRDRHPGGTPGLGPRPARRRSRGQDRPPARRERDRSPGSSWPSAIPEVNEPAREAVWGRPADLEREGLADRQVQGDPRRRPAPRRRPRPRPRSCSAGPACSATRLFDSGGDVGPDLTGSDRANPDYILENVLDPSATVSRDYTLTNVATTDGRLVSGIIREQNDKSLDHPDGQRADRPAPRGHRGDQALDHLDDARGPARAIEPPGGPRPVRLPGGEIPGRAINKCYWRRNKPIGSNELINLRLSPSGRRPCMASPANRRIPPRGIDRSVARLRLLRLRGRLHGKLGGCR